MAHRQFWMLGCVCVCVVGEGDPLALIGICLRLIQSARWLSQTEYRHFKENKSFVHLATLLCVDPCKFPNRRQVYHSAASITCFHCITMLNPVHTKTCSPLCNRACWQNLQVEARLGFQSVHPHAWTCEGHGSRGLQTCHHLWKDF